MNGEFTSEEAYLCQMEAIVGSPPSTDPDYPAWAVFDDIATTLSGTTFVPNVNYLGEQ